MNKNATDTIVIRQVQGINGLELVRGVGVKQSFTRHFHRKYYIGLVESGIRRCLYRSANYMIYPGDIMIFCPGEVHQCSAPADGHTYRLIGIEPFWFDAANPSNSYFSGFSELTMPDEVVSHHFRTLYFTLDSLSPKLEKETALTLFISHLLKCWQIQPGEARTFQCVASLQKIRDHLESNYTANVSLQELSSIGHLSPYHLVRNFSRFFGLPPHMYLNQYRVLQAKSLILHGKPLSEIGPAVGFYDQSHFIRQFKRFVGVNPGVFLNRG